MKNEVTIDISLAAIFKVFGALLGLWFLYSIREVVLLFFIVIIVVMALDPVVVRLQKHMARALAVGLVFFVIIGLMSIGIALILPPLIEQLSQLTSNLPTYLQTIRTAYNPSSESVALTQQIIQSISNQLSNLSHSIFNATIGFFNGLIALVTVIVMSVYILLEEKGIRNVILSLLPTDNRENIYKAFNKIGDKLGAWLRGQLVLMLIIGIASTIWATVLGLPYALTLGLWAGLTEAIPFLGPIFGGIPMVLLALHFSPLKAVIAFLLILVTQQLESNFLVPNIMRRAIGVSPVIIILALLIGSKLFGISGAILSLPFAAATMVVIQDWPTLRRKR